MVSTIAASVDARGAVAETAPLDRGRVTAFLSRRGLETAFLLYTAAAIVLFPMSCIHFVTTNAQRMEITALVVLFVAFCGWLLVGSDRLSSSTTRAYIRRAGPTVLVCHAALIFGISAFSTFKINIPNVLPFYADPYIATVDQWLLGGQAWILAHKAPERTGFVVDFVYSRVWFAALIGDFTLATLLHTGGLLKRYLWSILLVFMLLGSLLALPFSSVGPIFYDDFYGGTRFAGLTDALNANAGLYYVKQYASYLLAAQRAGVPEFGSGISAMPSVHVAIAVLVAWHLTSIRRWFAPLAWLYAAFILFGSVYTGWHYFADGVFSAVVTSALWIAISRCYRMPLLAPRLA